MKSKINSKRIISIGLFLMSLFFTYSISALTFDHLLLDTRIDTRYQMRTGDNTTDQDIYQYHAIDAKYNKSVSLYWYGGLRKDLNATTGKIGGVNATETDIALRGLPDAINSDQTLEYRVYEAYLSYKTKKLLLLAGRKYLYDYAFTQIDGGKLSYKVNKWLIVEGFGGKPWHYSFYNYYNAKEFTGGGGIETLFFSNKLNTSVRYLNIQEQTYKQQIQVLSNESAAYQANKDNTYISNDNLVTAKSRYNWSPLFQPAIDVSSLENSLKDMNLSLNGYSEKLLLNYNFSYYQQFMGVNDFGNRLTQLSAILTASNPYYNVSGSLNKSIADILHLNGAINDLQIEVGGSYRAPMDALDVTRYNPKYIMVRSGLIFVTDSRWYLQAFFEEYKTFSDDSVTNDNGKNDFQNMSGEISKKYNTWSATAGTSFSVNKYEALYSQTVVKDSFYAREYYLKLRWWPIKFIDFSLFASFEQAEMTSLTAVTSDAPEYNATANNIRNYYRIDFNTGIKF